MNHRTCDFCLMDMFEDEKPSECYEETHVLIHGLRSRLAALEAENKRYKEALENVKTITENSGWGLPSQEKTITIINSALNGGKGNE